MIGTKDWQRENIFQKKILWLQQRVELNVSNFRFFYYL